jgi:hypothetical protein
MATVPPVYADQFEQGAVRGDLDLTITKSGVIVGVMGVIGATTAYAGDRVKIDTANTAPGQIKFVPAADNEVAFGCIKRTAKSASFVQGDEVEVTFMGGPVIYQVAAATVRPGYAVEMASGFVQEKAAGSQLGMSLDYAIVSTMLRVVTGWVAC